MRVPPDIVQDLLGTGEGTFGVDDPLDVPQGCEIARPGVRIAQRVPRARQVPRAGAERGLELFENESAKEAGEDPDREKEPGSARNPARGIGREATARHDAVQMRMMEPAPTIPRA